MPDPIGGINTSQPIQPANSSGVTVGAGATGTAETGSSGADVADVAQTETLLNSILQAANNTPGIDQAKVAELQKAVASGAYQANPQSTAQKIVELEILLGTAGQLR